jgi:DNA adenine methylase
MPRTNPTAQGTNTKKTSSIFLDAPIATDSQKVSGIRRRHSRRIVFGWYGGKFSHLDWLLPLLPPCHHYCEPFSGSGAVLLNREPSPVETYNDIDGEVVNFFRVLRDSPEDLIKTLALTPFSREEYHQAIYGETSGISDVEKARRFYIKARQTRTGLAQTASLGRWANCKNTSRSGMSGVVSRWLGGIDALDEIAQRLIRVQIENRPAIDLIHLYDSPTTLFYCDPPYLHATRGDAKAYAFEMDEDQHRELAAVVNQCQGMVAVSGYDHPLMNEIFPPKHWRKILSPDKTIHSTKDRRVEVLWINYDLTKSPLHQQKEIFE